MLYRAINGDSDSAAGVERREDPGPQPHPQQAHRYEVSDYFETNLVNYI